MISDHLTSLEWSKRLGELGVPQKSVFVWRKYQNWICELRSFDYTEKGWHINELEERPAFLSSELGEFLPGKYNSVKRFDNKFWIIEDGEKECEMCIQDEIIFHYQTIADTEVNARSAMLCYLIENGLIKI